MQVYNILATKGRHVVTIRPEQTVEEGIALLAQHNIGVLVVVDSRDKLVGILSERDIVRRAARDKEVFSRQVQDVMTYDVISCGSQDDLMPVSQTMTQKHIRHLPVLEGGELVGIVSMRDMLKAQRDEYYGTVETLQIQLSADA